MQVERKQARTSWINGLDPDLRNLVRDNMFEHEYAPGQTICEEGSAPLGAYEMRSGRVRAWTVNADGKEQVLTYFKSPVTFGEASVFLGSEFHWTVTAESPVRVGILPCHLLRSLAEQFSSVALSLLKSLSWRQAIQMDMLIERDRDNLDVRLASRLVSLANAHAQIRPSTRGKCEYLLHLTQSDLANLLNTSRQSINQIIRKWDAQGLLKVEYGQISIYDLEALQAYSASHLVRPELSLKSRA